LILIKDPLHLPTLASVNDHSKFQTGSPYEILHRTALILLGEWGQSNIPIPVYAGKQQFGCKAADEISQRHQSPKMTKGAEFRKFHLNSAPFGYSTFLR
jgi:hypothetical protein